MIDFVKIAIRSATLAMWLLENKSFDFVSDCIEATGELISFPKTAQLNHLKITIHESNRVEIRGSLHKYWHGNNFTDFTYSDLCECINSLCEKLNLNSSEARLENVEFGVNVSPPFNPTTFYRSVIAFKNETPGKMGRTQIGIDFYKQRYGIKIYDKGRQYNQSENILRFEVKVTRMEFLKGTGILYLSDLTDIDKLRSLSALLSENFGELIIDDKINTGRLNKNERRIYQLCKNSKEWEDFSPKKRFLYKEKFTDIINRHGQRQWRQLTQKLILEKWNELLSTTPKSGNELTDYSNKEKECSNSSNSLLLPSLTDNRYCQSCGRDISTQKTGSKFCSEKLYGREAKKCRNTDSNPRNHIKRKIETITGRGVLFDIRPFMFCKQQRFTGNERSN